MAIPKLTRRRPKATSKQFIEALDASGVEWAPWEEVWADPCPPEPFESNPQARAGVRPIRRKGR